MYLPWRPAIHHDPLPERGPAPGGPVQAQQSKRVLDLLLVRSVSSLCTHTDRGQRTTDVLSVPVFSGTARTAESSRGCAVCFFLRVFLRVCLMKVYFFMQVLQDLEEGKDKMILLKMSSRDQTNIIGMIY